MPGLAPPPTKSSPPSPSTESQSSHLSVDQHAEEKEEEGGASELRLLSRSPHPYHRQNFELLHPLSSLVSRSSSTSDGEVAAAIAHSSSNDVAFAHNQTLQPFAKESAPTSDSGTDADDEHFLKGLPAPKTKLHKGLRGRNEVLSGTSTPLLSPALLEEEGRKVPPILKLEAALRDKRANAERTRRKKEVIRRATEILILFSLGAILCANREVKPFVHAWSRELTDQAILMAVLAAIYPIRVVVWAYLRGTPSKRWPLHIPSSFDPAPLLYPPLIPIYVSLLLAPTNPLVILPNLVLSISTLPNSLIPLARPGELVSPLHWLLSTSPLVISSLRSPRWEMGRLEAVTIRETAVLLYPLHQNLCLLLHRLTTTSLLPAELQLLSVALINIYLLSSSPQMVLLKALIWGGGMGLLISCGYVIRWGITLARVPKWRFRRVLPSTRRVSLLRRVAHLLPLRKVRYEVFGGSSVEHSDSDSCAGAFSDEDGGGGGPSQLRSSFDSHRHGNRSVLTSAATFGADGAVCPSPGSHDGDHEIRFNLPSPTPTSPTSATVAVAVGLGRRHTLPSLVNSAGAASSRSKTHTPSGRRKRSASSSIRAFFSLTQAQATARKWVYAAWVYACILTIIFVGIRGYASRVALDGEEPLGWALGYMLGDLPAFRLQVFRAHLETWVCLPPRDYTAASCGGGGAGGEGEACRQGWVEQLRRVTFGEANTRLIMSAYWLGIIVVGLAVVLRLTPVFEVDTRRKVFHFMMVGMLLPATYVDPTYIAFALSLVLAIFLLLDLLRASQLPPLSKPIASFLTPYVDGRDLRGPVVISHIFLLIGCSIPLWLSLAAIRRTGEGPLRGWEVPTRDTSMVSGVVCVGLGDAAASLIGRRWGHRKWVWGGGKSLEGSAAFAAAVFLGLVGAGAWLRLGGWPVTGEGLTATAAVRSPTGCGGCGCSPGAAGLWRCAVSGWGSGGTHGDEFYRSWLRSVRGAAACASMASLTEAVLTGGNDNVVVPVVLWTCVKSLGA